MRISLFYNETAGDATSLEHLRGALERHGHELVQIVEKKSRVRRMLGLRTDLVVAAGGDGTVAAAARLLAGRGIPLAILPLGTANNIASSVGLTGPLEQLIQRWASASPRPFDLGVACGAWGERRFVESVGVGLIPAGIAAAKAHAATHDIPSTMKPDDAARTYRDVLMRLKPRSWTITLNGTSTTDDFLLVEILNIPSIGPNLVISPDANPSDGCFSVVTAAAHQREELRRFLDERVAGRDCAPALLTHNASRVEMHGGHQLHVDDKLVRSPSVGPVSIRIEPAAVQVLV